MNWRILGMVAIAVLTVRGVHMALRPLAYVGPGKLDARNPQVARRFGIFHAVAGALVFAMILIQFVQE